MLAQIDADPAAWGRAYPVAKFVCGEAVDALSRLVPLLDGRVAVEPGFSDELRSTKVAAVNAMRAEIGPYATIAELLATRDAARRRLGARCDNRKHHLGQPLPSALRIARFRPCAFPRASVRACRWELAHTFAVQGSRKVVVLCGDGGLFLNVGELATAVQENVDIVLIVMNDGGYGVIKNIQDHSYGGRHYFADLKSPDLGEFAKVMGMHFGRVRHAEEFAQCDAACAGSARPCHDRGRHEECRFVSGSLWRSADASKPCGRLPTETNVEHRSPRQPPGDPSNARR